MHTNLGIQLAHANAVDVAHLSGVIPPPPYGTPCVDWSSIGKRLSVNGRTMHVFLAWCAIVLLSSLSIVLHELVDNAHRATRTLNDVHPWRLHVHLHACVQARTLRVMVIVF
jgi:site-specific DNA-cytosine methylase